MSCLKRLQITHLRNLEKVSLKLSPNINLFYGENGSGKTSLLEAISLLGLGRSFRSHKTRSLIHHQQPQLTVFGELNMDSINTAVGLQKERSGNTVIRVDGETAASAVILAQQLPLQIINADSFQLIEGSPNQRRRFLDWMVFHVKPEFIDVWRRLQRVIKQRNSALKHDKITRLDLAPWDTEFVQLSMEIHRLRGSVFAEFKGLFSELQQVFPSVATDVEVKYLPGWNSEEPFDELLQQDFERDKRDGYTHHGPQRAEIKLYASGKPAVDVLSRGQEKSLICALHVIQAQLYKEKTGKTCVFLVDDLLAELDIHHAQRLTQWLKELGGQVFVTGVTKTGLIDAWKADNDIAMFHVEQGVITEQ
ncbi:MAG: DNA replication/repair protein RecF [Cellvibrionaceae bacterium]